MSCVPSSQTEKAKKQAFLFRCQHTSHFWPRENPTKYKRGPKCRQRWKCKSELLLALLILKLLNPAMHSYSWSNVFSSLPPRANTITGNSFHPPPPFVRILALLQFILLFCAVCSFLLWGSCVL
ncbi:hypothetical protein HDV63DRAFT_52486 [Trichoderma sp. SZMC 28014]